MMKKLLTALLVVGALAFTAVPASASPWVTVWHSWEGKLQSSNNRADPGCYPVPSPGDCDALYMAFTNNTRHTEGFWCNWRENGRHERWMGDVQPGATTYGQFPGAIPASFVATHVSCRVWKATGMLREA